MNLIRAGKFESPSGLLISMQLVEITDKVMSGLVEADLKLPFSLT